MTDRHDRPNASQRVNAVQELRRSGASGSHASGTRRQRGRSASRKAAIRFSSQAG